MSKRRVHLMIVLIWLCSSLISFPAIAWWRVTDPGPSPPSLPHHSSAPSIEAKPQVISLIRSGHRDDSISFTTGASCEFTRPNSATAFENQSEPLEVYVSTERVPRPDDTIEQEVDSSELCKFTDDPYYQLVGSAVSFYIPTSIMFYLYFRIYRTARSVKRNIENGERLCSSYRPSRPSNAALKDATPEPDKENSSSAGGGGGGGGSNWAKEGSAEQQGNKWHSSGREPQLTLRVHRGGKNSVKSQSFRAPKPPASRLSSPQPQTPIRVQSPLTITTPPQRTANESCQETHDSPSKGVVRSTSPLSIGSSNSSYTPVLIQTQVEIDSNAIRLELCSPAESAERSPLPILDLSGCASITRLNGPEQKLETPPIIRSESTPSHSLESARRQLSLSDTCPPERRTMDTSTSTTGTGLSGGAITSSDSLCGQSPVPGPSPNPGPSFRFGAFAFSHEAACKVAAPRGSLPLCGPRLDRKSIVSVCITVPDEDMEAATANASIQKRASSRGFSRGFMPIFRKLTVLRDELRRLTRDQKAAKTLGTVMTPA